MLAAEKLSHQDHVSLPPLLSWLTGILARCPRRALFLLLLILVVLLVGHAIRCRKGSASDVGIPASGYDWVAVFVPQAPTPMSGNVMSCPQSACGCNHHDG